MGAVNPKYLPPRRPASSGTGRRPPGGPGPGKAPDAGSVTPGPAPAAGTLRLTCTVSVADPCGRPATQVLIADDPTFGLTAHPRCGQHPAAFYGRLLDRAGIGTRWLILDLPPAQDLPPGEGNHYYAEGIPRGLFGGAQGCST